MSRKRTGFLGAGLSMILLAFVMLCMISFAVLSLSTARADLQMSQKIADRTTAYYTAQEAAYDKVKIIDGILQGIYNESSGTDLDRIQKILEQDVGITSEKDGKMLICSFCQTVDETSQLEVELKITLSPEEGGRDVQISRWQVQPTSEWEADQKLPVLQRETEPE